MTGKRKRNAIVGAFVTHTKEMRESLAWLSLPDAARRALDRLELEHMRHGGADNGRLPCTHGDFHGHGIRKASVAETLRQCVYLGFAEVTQTGGRSISSFRRPNLYRLTYVQGCGRSPDPTHDWRLIQTPEQVRTALARAKAEKNHATQPQKLRDRQDADRHEKQKAGRATASTTLDAPVLILSIFSEGTVSEHQVAHQPTPWSIGRDGLLYDANGRSVRLSGLGTALNATSIFPHANANRDFLVVAVNAYYSLQQIRRE